MRKGRALDGEAWLFEALVWNLIPQKVRYVCGFTRVSGTKRDRLLGIEMVCHLPATSDTSD